MPPIVEPWQQIDTNELERIKRAQKAKTWADEQRAKVSKMWADQQKKRMRDLMTKHGFVQPQQTGIPLGPGNLPAQTSSGVPRGPQDIAQDYPAAPTRGMGGVDLAGGLGGTDQYPMGQPRGLTPLDVGGAGMRLSTVPAEVVRSSLGNDPNDRRSPGQRLREGFEQTATEQGPTANNPIARTVAFLNNVGGALDKSNEGYNQTGEMMGERFGVLGQAAGTAVGMGTDPMSMLPADPVSEAAMQLGGKAIGAGARAVKRAAVSDPVQATVRALEEWKVNPERGSIELPGGVSEPAPKRYYHGTNTAFERPEPGKFQAEGLFGPGYYLTDAPEVAGGAFNTAGGLTRSGYAQKGFSEAPALVHMNWSEVQGILNDVSTDTSLTKVTRDFLGELATYTETNARRQYTSPGYYLDSFQHNVSKAAWRKITDAAERLWSERPNRPAPQVRAVDVPKDVRLFDVDAPIGEEIAARAKRFLGPDADIYPQMQGEDLYSRLTEDLDSLPAFKQKAEVNQKLHDWGFDGIQYAGGKRIPMTNAAGEPIEHTAVVIFPDALPRIKNAISGTTMGASTGGLAGIEQDDEGNVSYNPEKGALGFAAGALLGNKGVQKGIAKVAKGALPAGAKAIEKTTAEEVERLRLDKFPDWSHEIITKSAADVDFARTQRRGVIGEAAAEGLAKDVEANTSVDAFIRRGAAGKSYNTEEVRALRNTVLSQTEVVSNLSKEIATAKAGGLVTDLLRARSIAEGEKLGALLTVAEGAKAEWGRAGIAWQRAARLAENPEDGIRRIYSKLGGGENAQKALDEFQTMVDGGADPIQMAHFWAKVDKPPPGFNEWFTTLRYNSMLSGPRTFEINFISNSLEVPWRLGRDTLASTLRGKPGEMAPEIAGIWLGLQRGSRAGMDILAHGITKEAAIAGEIPTSLAARTRNPVGKAAALALEAPGRVLGAADEVAKQVAFHMVKGRLAAVDASRAGLRGKAWSTRVAESLLENKPGWDKTANEAAARMTYHNEMGGFGAGIQGFRQKAPVIANIAIPFLKTVYNITAKGIDRSVLGLPHTAIDVAAGRYGPRTLKNLGERLAGEGAELAPGLTPLGERLGDNVIGGVIGVGLLGLAGQGLISGKGPDSAQDRDLLKADGWLPYAVKIGDRWISYTNWGPAAVSLALSAAVIESSKYGDETVSPMDSAFDLFKRVAELGTEQSFLQGIGTLYKAATEPDIYAESFLAQLPQTFIPYGSAINTAAQAGDPLTRKAERGNVGEAVAGRIPGLRETLPAAQDVLGREIPNPYQGLAAVVPLRQGSRSDEDNSVIRAFTDAGVTMGTPPDAVRKIPLTEAEKRTYQQVMGETLQTFYKRIEADLAGRTPEQVAAMLTKMKERAREVAADRFMLNLTPEERKRRALEARAAS